MVLVIEREDVKTCPADDVLRDRVRLRACALGEAGSIIGEGIGFEEEESVSFPWVAFGGRAAVSLPITQASSLVLGGDLVAPVVRPRYVDLVPPHTLYHEPAPFALTVGFGLEARIR